MRCHALVLLAAPFACAPKAPLGGPASRTAEYDVAVVSASGERRVTSVYRLRLMPVGDHGWSVRTLWTEGTWEDGGDAMAFDSRAPGPADPWPLTLQHAIAAVPAVVAFDETGRPFALTDETAWSDGVRAAVDALALPEEARSTAAQLVDADGLVRDLQRNFVGTPSPEGSWQRPERVAGVECVRTETCASSRDRGRTTYTCAGPLRGPEDGTARLHEATSTTRLVVDDNGLHTLETGYLGTLVLLGPDGTALADRAIGGRRLVQRR